MPRRLLVLCIVGMLAGCGRASGGVAPDALFTGLDGDGDGRLTPTEARLSSLAFVELDTNGDGAIDVLEWRGDARAPNVIWQVQQQREAQRDVTRQDRTGATL
jgi:hypothetical protein